MLGALYAEVGRADLAQQHLETALLLVPDNGPSILLLGLLATDEKRTEEALVYFERAAALMPDDARAHFRLGEARQYVREMDAAEEALRTALTLAPELPEARLQLGILYLETWRNEAALAELTRAAALDPDNAAIRRQLGRAALAVGDELAARRELEAALRLDPFLVEAYLALGNLLMRQGESESGRDLLLRFRELQRSEAEIETRLARLSKAPDDAAARREHVSLLLAEGRHEQALDTVRGWIVGSRWMCGDLSAAYRDALPGAADPGAVLLGLGSLLVECGDAADAITYLEQARLSSAPSLELLLALARAYDRTGQADVAARWRAEAEALRPPQ